MGDGTEKLPTQPPPAHFVPPHDFLRKTTERGRRTQRVSKARGFGLSWLSWLADLRVNRPLALAVWH